MPDFGYMVYQAERVKSPAEQRQVDADLGQRAAAVSRLWLSFARVGRALRRRMDQESSLGRANSGSQEREVSCQPCSVRANWS
jgi:hypothetical protein